MEKQSLIIKYFTQVSPLIAGRLGIWTSKAWLQNLCIQPRNGASETPGLKLLIVLGWVGTWIFTNYWVLKQDFSRNQRAVRTKMAWSYSKEKNQTKLWVVGLALEFPTDTEPEIKAPTHELISFLYLCNRDIDAYLWLGNCGQHLLVTCLPEMLTNGSMPRREPRSQRNNGKNQ